MLRDLYQITSRIRAFCSTYLPRPVPIMFINPRRACAARVTVVVPMCVCLSVKSNLTSGASVRPENSVTYSVGNGVKKIVGVSLKPLRSKVMASFAYP